MMIKTLILILMFFLVSCLPKATERTPENSQNSSNNNPTTPNSDSYTTADVELGWYYLYNTTNNLNYTRTNTNVAYIRGTMLESFLQNLENFSQKVFCIEMDFNQSERFRVRAVPLSVNNVGSGKKTLYLRVDLGNAATNSAACNRQPNVIGVNYRYNLNDICTNCTTNIQASTFRFYEVLSTGLNLVQSSSLNLGVLSFTLLAPVSSSGPSLCTNSSCQSAGYNCCLEGQCVNDGALRSNLNSTQIQDAQNLTAGNALAFLNYPQYFYICPQTQPSNPNNNPIPEPNDPLSQAQIRFEALKLDYHCVQEIIEKSLSQPYQDDPINESTTYTKCSMDQNNELHWEKVLTRLYDNCNCVDQPDLSSKLVYCPKYYYYAPAVSLTGEPTQIECAAYDQQAPLPFQQLNIFISGKTAPHRLFNKNALELNPYKPIPQGTEIQNETHASTSDFLNEFFYLDNTFSIPSPDSGFNMNAVLGEVTVALDRAKPAYMIDVDMDQNYLIATTSGMQVPCPTCAADSWFSSFTATPTTYMGTGLQSIGHSTTPDEFGYNTPLGNWEDTIFGRACWVPPTMIPFAHKPYNTSVQDQRIKRLTTQAAMYVNGYQRDWYGFNRGALIGSWDGVNWFAVGKSRIVKSNTNKLYLAINAPFADLAENTMHTVSVQLYDGVSTGATMDYDPSLPFNHLLQNEAGTCQRYHQCVTDTDCITRLGWDYACADVSNMIIRVPSFNANQSTEQQNIPTGFQTVASLLNQNNLGGNSNLRCVYRGAGSICAQSAGTTTGVNALQPTSARTKLLTCAPNHYCAPLNSSSFNKEVSRFAAPIDDLINVNPKHYFGRDAEILGRPREYLLSSNTLPTFVQSAIQDVVRAHGGANNTIGAGLCRPGKQVVNTAVPNTENPFTRHNSGTRDSFTVNNITRSRTDFINQISGCESTPQANATNQQKIAMSCPVINGNGNIDYFTSNIFINSAYQTSANQQNVCGNRERFNNDSIFSTIEAKPLPTQVNQKTLVQDACLRRAGAVCHTDLDCSPNKMHAEVALTKPSSHFGNSQNKKYYEEYLVCGQSDPKPYFSDANFHTFNMSQNRCCREVGMDITTYTPRFTSNLNGNLVSGSESATININLNSSNAIVNNTYANRYERYAVANDLANNQVTADSQRDLTASLFNSGKLSQVDNILTPNQWKTIGSVNDKTCCGGGWIRKFSDGTNDWTRTDRLQLDMSNFRCLNYQTPLLNPTTTSSDFTTFGTSYSAVNNEYGKYCTSTVLNGGGCAQIEIPPISLTFDLDKTCESEQACLPATNKLCVNQGSAGTIPYFPAGQVTESVLEEGTQYISTLSVAQSVVPYGFSSNLMTFYAPVSGDQNPSTSVKLNVTDTNDPQYRRNVTIKIPSYVPMTPSSQFKIYVQSATGGSPQKPIECLNSYQTLGDTVGPYLNNPNPPLFGGASFTLNSSNYPDLLENGHMYSLDTSGLYPDELMDPFVGWWGHAFCHYIYLEDRTVRVFINNAGTSGVPNFNTQFHSNNSQWGVGISFVPPGSKAFYDSINGVPNPTPLPPDPQRAKPQCNIAHYLDRLGRLELTGIPQVTFEKIVCNDDVTKLVPGIFKARLNNNPAGVSAFGAFNYIDHFNNPNNSFRSTSEPNRYHTTYHALEQEPIFSEDQFKCCTPLGKETKIPTNCCSGFGVLTGQNSGRYRCMLPEATDLSVYFNRFVSSEGKDPAGPAQLIDSDFDPNTGEPKVQTTTNNKLAALGQAFCVGGGVRTGGFYGSFRTEPSTTNPTGGKLFSVIDSFQDFGNSQSNGATTPVGYQPFSQGFRWNHHIYCDQAAGGGGVNAQ